MFDNYAGDNLRPTKLLLKILILKRVKKLLNNFQNRMMTKQIPAYEHDNCYFEHY